MSIPPAVDPRQLAAEIEAAASEFNRLANLAAELRITVEAELHAQGRAGHPPQRPLLMVRVIAPL